MFKRAGLLGSVACVGFVSGCGGGKGGGGSPLPIPPSYSIGGTVTGLSGTGLVLGNHGANNLSVATNGAFTFAGVQGNGTLYNVSVLTQPSSPSQTCAVTSGSGTVTGGNVTSVAVTCTTNTYTVGGTVTGLDAAGLVLQNNAGDDLEIAADGAFTFGTSVASGAEYAVTVETQPNAGPAQTCSVTNESGTVGGSAIANVAVDCVTHTGKFLYVPNALSNTISAYTIDAATGALTEIVGSPFPTNEPSPRGAASDAAGSYLYVTSTGSAGDPPRISEYAIDADTGALTELLDSPYDLSDPPPPDGAVQINGPLVHPSSTFGIVTLPATGQIYGGSVDPDTGELTTIPGLSPLTVGVQLGFPGGDLTGQVLYVPHNTVAGGPGALAAYQVTLPGGTLTPIGAVVPTGGNFPSMVSVNRANSLLFVPNSQSENIAVFALDSAGVPTAVGAPVTTGAGSTPTFAVAHRRSDFLYVTSTATAEVLGYTFDAAGQLTPTLGSPYASGGTTPLLGLVARTGGVFYVTNRDSNNIQGFTIDGTTGVLTPSVAPPVVTGNLPAPAINDPSGKYLYSVNTGDNTISVYSINRTTAAITLIDTEATGLGAGGLAIVGLQ